MPNRGTHSFNKCQHPGCRAVTLKHQFCQRHRDRPPGSPPSPEERARKNKARRERMAKRRASSGLRWVI